MQDKKISEVPENTNAKEHVSQLQMKMQKTFTNIHRLELEIMRETCGAALTVLNEIPLETKKAILELRLEETRQKEAEIYKLREGLAENMRDIYLLIQTKLGFPPQDPNKVVL